MIRRVFINGYKSLRRVDLALYPLTVIVGPNASGKSNLFDALGLLSRMVTSRSLSDAFNYHRGDPLEAFDYGHEGIAGLLRREEVSFTIEVDVQLDDSVVESTEEMIRKYVTRTSNGSGSRRVVERLLRYSVRVGMNPQKGVLRVLDESLRALKEQDGHLTPDKRRRPFLERIGDKIRLRMEGQARPSEYEVGLSFTIVSQPLHPPHYPHLVAFREELSRWQFYYFEPQLMREENAVKETLNLTPRGGDLAAFYYTLRNRKPQQFLNLEAALRTLVPSIAQIMPELTEEGKVRLKVNEHGVDFTAKVISEGTLRLLGLMAILNPENSATVIGFEEPENGVHPRRLKLIADLLRNASEYKQVLVNTHSPVLPDYLQDAHLVTCSKQATSSVFRPLQQKQGLFRAPSVEEALEDEPSTVSQRILRGDWG